MPRRHALTAALALALVAILAPAAHAAPEVAITEAVTKATWKQGYLTGSVRFTATSTEAATLFFFVRRASNKGPVLAATQLDVAAGGTVQGTLKLPAQPMPLTYKLRVSHVTDAGNVLLPPAADVKVPAPPEGVVEKAVVSHARGGKGVVSAASPVPQMWVRFRFKALPTAKGRKVIWFSPSGQIIGTVLPTSKFVIDSFIRSRSGALPRGNWEARLVVGGKIARRTFVRIR
jgi:hypothetical protein